MLFWRILITILRRVDTRRGRSLVASRTAGVVHGIIHIVGDGDRIVGYVTKSETSFSMTVGRSEQDALVVACRQSDGFQEIFLPVSDIQIDSLSYSPSDVLHL